MEYLVIVKRDCETCQMVAPVLADLQNVSTLTLYSQDDTDISGSNRRCPG